MRTLWLILLVAIFHCGLCTDPDIEDEELRARAYLQILNKKTLEHMQKLALLRWQYITNLTDVNLQTMLEGNSEVAAQEKELWKATTNFNWHTFSDYGIKRQFRVHSVLGQAALPQDKLTRLNKIISEMQKIYSTAKICDFNNPDNCSLSLEPELTTILENSRNADELKHVWVEWRKVIGPPCKHLFKEFVDLFNEAARLNNFTDGGEYNLRNYEDPKFKDQIEALWQQLKPLYLQIHAYVRHKLRKEYGDIVSEKGPIPAHLLGNMWTQDWQQVANFSLPYPEKSEEDLTEALVRQNYTTIRIFKTAEEFFKSLNLPEMPETFWNNSIFKKVNGTNMICHPSATDFYNGDDVRIKQCTEITGTHFVTAHHEMGHIEYFLLYKDQPIKFRTGANPGFHEAVGDLISLSVQSRKHLRKIGLIQSQKDDAESVLNNLFQIGLKKIVFLPFAYLMDLWRWDVFAGKVTPENYNCRWWELREHYQGIEPPVDRTDQDFDPVAKYHIIANVPYIRYFVSTVIQFQFHKGLCEKIGQYDPNLPSQQLSECDIYQNADAGEILKKMLKLGSSRPWPDALEIVTGQRTMDASGILEYFRPLRKWLEEENEKNNVFIGWEETERKVFCSADNKEPLNRK